MNPRNLFQPYGSGSELAARRGPSLEGEDTGVDRAGSH